MPAPRRRGRAGEGISLDPREWEGFPRYTRPLESLDGAPDFMREVLRRDRVFSPFPPGEPEVGIMPMPRRGLLDVALGLAKHLRLRWRPR